MQLLWRSQSFLSLVNRNRVVAQTNSFEVPFSPDMICTGMFLRLHERVKNGKEHTNWSLVETVSTAAGPRQHTLCNLGELNSSAHARWQKTDGGLQGARREHAAQAVPSEAEVPDDPTVARVQVKKVRVERTRRLV